MLQNTGWLQFFTELPNGINQVLIDAYIQELGTRHFVLLDDVKIQSCEHFSEYASLFFPVMYIQGSQNIKILIEYHMYT